MPLALTRLSCVGPTKTEALALDAWGLPSAHVVSEEPESRTAPTFPKRDRGRLPSVANNLGTADSPTTERDARKLDFLIAALFIARTSRRFQVFMKRSPQATLAFLLVEPQQPGQP